jgi:hypothetical protein
MSTMDAGRHWPDWVHELLDGVKSRVIENERGVKCLELLEPVTQLCAVKAIPPNAAGEQVVALSDLRWEMQVEMARILWENHEADGSRVRAAQ